MPVAGYEGIYEVSDTGLVRSLDRYVDLSGEKRRRIQGKQLSAKRNKEGYLFVSLCREGVVKTNYIHRLVAKAFIPNPNELPEVNHLNGIKTDNSATNLEWCTHQDNVRHAYANGLNRNAGGSHAFAAMVTDNELGQTFATVQDWCAARGIPYSTGRNLLNNQGRSRTIDLTQVTKVSKTNNGE